MEYFFFDFCFSEDSNFYVQKSTVFPEDAAPALSDSFARLLLIIDTFTAFLDC